MAGGALANTADVGSPGLPGSYSYVDGRHHIDGSGTGIGGAADRFRFAWTPQVQDFTVSARVTAFTASNANAKAGVMLRSSATAADAAMAAVVLTRSMQVQFVYRVTAGTAATSVTGATTGVPTFVRLSRIGFSIAGAYSTDGMTWTPVGTPQRLNVDGGLSQAGLAITSGTNGDYAAATFTSVALAGNGGDWSHRTVGASDDTGGATYDAVTGTQTILAGGSGIGGWADAFGFVSRPLGASGSAVARIESITGGAEAGVMVRATAAADAPFAAVLASTTGVRFAWRSAAGTPASSISVAATGVPLAVRILRDGDRFQGSYSANGGATWLRIGSGSSVAVSMPSAAQAGLVATANAADPTLATASFTGVSLGAIASPGAGILTAGDEAFLDDLSRRTANWFLVTQNPTSGLFPDRAHVQAGGWLGGESSMASTGFGLSALVIAASRGWVTDGYDRALRTLRFLWNDADMKNPANHGYFYHFVNQTTGARSGSSELSSIDTALLISGVLTVGQYWKGTELETLARQIYDRVDWTFMQPNGTGTQLRMAWTPEGGFAPARWDSWSEGPLLYLLAMGSTTHPISESSWHSFARDQSVTTYAGMTFYHASGAPLFTNQYPQGWFDLRGYADRADADPTAGVLHLDPYQNARRHTLAQRQALIDAAAGSDARFDYYGPNAWGLTASDSVSGYQVFGGPPLGGNVDGTIAPTAPGGSLAFTPREAIDCLMNLRATYPASYRTYGFVDAFNPRPTVNWYDADAIGIDQGMLLVAAENLRSGLVWQTFMSDPAAQRARDLGFMPNGSTAPPAIAASSFAFETGQAVSFSFTQDVAASLDAGDLEVVNTSTGAAVLAPAWTFARSAAGRLTSATVTFISALADGNYEVRVRSNSVSTSDGTANVRDLVVPFFVLAGDANRDRKVDFSDLLILAQHYGTSGRTFSQGNFDYGADGRVDFADLLLLAQRYGQNVAAAVNRYALASEPVSTKAKRRPGNATGIV